MTRKSLCRDIQSVHQRLNLRQEQFQLANEQSKAALKKTSPYLIIGIGLLAGVVTHVIGWRKAYTVVNTSFSFYPFLLRSTRRLMSMRND
ncbi:hypothetical protein [Neptunomonas antarctica]|uniref:YqjK-like protein n=1 Tax=Neptunomonas antarctica TaxID=619304 RepID=A0A1N7IYW5_9GAMM|nr:hypothetical protein [Neptunomonas antarctica]SIS42298.1 hypothetical protein SAMN05421760_101357 [Neptunomonas antarctica]